MSKINQTKVLKKIIVETLSQYPEGVALSDLYSEIDKNHQFPPSWYRLIIKVSNKKANEVFGTKDWRTIPQATLAEGPISIEPQWKNKIRSWHPLLIKEGIIYHQSESGLGWWKRTNNALPKFPKMTAEETKITEKIKHEAKPQSPHEKTETKTEPQDLLDKLLATGKQMSKYDLELFIDIGEKILTKRKSENNSQN